MITVPGPFTLSVVCMTTDAMPSSGDPKRRRAQSTHDGHQVSSAFRNWRAVPSWRVRTCQLTNAL